MDACYIVEAHRSPRGIGKPTGALHRITSVSLLSQLLDSVVSAHPTVPPAIEEVITGCVMPVGEQGANIARSAILASSLPIHVPGMQINRFCSSGLDAMNLLSHKIIAGQADLGIASGVECMSRVPILADGGALVGDPSIAYQHNIIPQGISADLIATLNGYTRENLDEYAVLSQQRASQAMKKGYLKSIQPVYSPSGSIALAIDEHPRPDTTLKALSALKPSFEMMGALAGYDDLAIFRYPQLAQIQHLHHAGNASGIVDGAAAILLANQKAIKEHNLTPKARIVATAQIGIDPTIMLTGPEEAIKLALKRAKLSKSQIDLWEINEAFASVVLHITEKLSLPLDKVNVNGGAIAYGHPLGATGAMLVGTLVDELIRSNKQFGAIALCTAAGMASCTIIESVSK
ncbi:MAG: acetyl-CoA C-acetyltransferase [Pseudomonadota bacterium]|nr:acetyl-CoA C-acetyltransferase [Pseudomonadota bacterium]